MFQHASGMLVARRIATKKANAEGREAHRDQKRTMVARRIATKNAFFFSRSRGGSDRVIRTVVYDPKKCNFVLTVFSFGKASLTS